MQLSGFQSSRHRISGFSLIEVLVASTVLMILVLVVAMVFQQSTGAWSGGTRKANTAMTLRSLLAQMQRDFVEAVDGREFSNVLSVADTAAVFPSDGQSAEFIAILGDPNDPAGDRVPYHIKYEYDGHYLQRTCSQMEYTGTAWTWADTTNTVTILNSSHPLADFMITSVPNAADASGLPLRVDIEARVANTNNALLVSGRSAGRDKVLGTDDDITASK